MRQTETPQYIYIVQAILERTKCKIGIISDLDRRLSEYNNITDKSKDNIYQYLFAGEVKNMAAVEKDIKSKFLHLREEKSREIYFYNSALFDDYVDFIGSHKHFIKEIILKKNESKPEIKIIKKSTPSIKDRGVSFKDIMQKAKRFQNDEFYTCYEDVEKELLMYDKGI
jgi:hypothetical protein